MRELWSAQICWREWIDIQGRTLSEVHLSSSLFWFYWEGKEFPPLEENSFLLTKTQFAKELDAQESKVASLVKQWQRLYTANPFLLNTFAAVELSAGQRKPLLGHEQSRRRSERTCSLDSRPMLFPRCNSWRMLTKKRDWKSMGIYYQMNMIMSFSAGKFLVTGCGIFVTISVNSLLRAQTFRY